jgi:hypothetical protein
MRVELGRVLDPDEVKRVLAAVFRDELARFFAG